MSSGALLVVTTHPFSAELGMGGRRPEPATDRLGPAGSGVAGFRKQARVTFVIDLIRLERAR